MVAGRTHGGQASVPRRGLVHRDLAPPGLVPLDSVLLGLVPPGLIPRSGHPLLSVGAL